ncbi:MAG: hypothetical protein KJN82_02905 [Bacteroidia bacterium]|nr:hypothetical protein [Bacteroidia bacterium]
MKKALFILLITISFIACKQEKSDPLSLENEIVISNNLDGVWQLVSFYNYKDNTIVDTVMANPENPQIKIFLDNKVMWSRKEPKGTEEYFGYGSYDSTDSTLVETLEFGSKLMLKVIDSSRVFSFELIKGNNTYSQIDIGPEGDRIFSENYVRIKE